MSLLSRILGLDEIKKDYEFFRELMTIKVRKEDDILKELLPLYGIKPEGSNDELFQKLVEELRPKRRSEK